MKTEVVVIGAGVAGIMTAWHLAKKGIPVVVCEKGRVAGEQSSRNWGYIRKQGRDPREIPAIIESLRIWENIEKDIEEDIGWHQGGSLYLAETEADLAYYENWLAGLETLWVGSGQVTPEELAKGISSGKSDIQAIDAEKALVSVKGAGGPVDPEAPVNAGLKVGDRVRVKTFHPMGHTRAPRYLRGREGVIDRIHGRHIYPDTHTVENVEDYPLYSVRFEGAELWGPDGNKRSAVYADLWEPYLEQP